MILADFWEKEWRFIYNDVTINWVIFMDVNKAFWWSLMILFFYWMFKFCHKLRPILYYCHNPTNNPKQLYLTYGVASRTNSGYKDSFWTEHLATRTSLNFLFLSVNKAKVKLSTGTFCYSVRVQLTLRIPWSYTMYKLYNMCMSIWVWVHENKYMSLSTWE